MNSCIPARLSSPWLPPLIRKGHSGIHARRFVESIAEEILLFPVARIGLRERIRVQAVVDYSRSLGEQLRRTLASDRQYPLSEVKAGVSCDTPSRCDRHG